MATVKHTGSKGMYSWWWNSHISPKNSKWLQENLRDMDTKVKQMIKLIEEDADSFARRAEMYYKKRPELMKLVEEFYRAYRALAERYDHATGVIRQAHRTMAEAFPNQVPMLFGDDSPGGSATEADPRTPETPPPIQALLEPDELQKGALGVSSHATKRNGAFTEESESVTIRKGLKQFNDLFGSEEAANHVKFAEARTRKGLNFHDIGEKEQSPLKSGSPDLRAQVLSESERVSKAEMEILNLKNALAKLEAEKEAGLLQYQQSLERLSNLEREVSRAQEESQGLSKRANQAEAEVQTLKDALSKLEAEKEANLVRYHQCSEKINNLENIISHAEMDAGELNERTNKAENEAQALKQDLARVKAEKEDALAQYKQCSETIINLEEKLLNAEESVRRLTERAEKAESELETLKRVVVELTKDKEVAVHQYQQCLETISSLERKLACAQEEVQRLNGKIDDGAANLKGAEERCSLLERTNQNLHTELESLLQKMGDQSQELAEKQKELGRLWTSIQEERMRFIEAETAFQTLQHLHSQSQEELRSLAMELQNRARILQVTETRIQSLEDELKRAKEENKGLSELNLSSVTSIKNLQDEILSLRKTIAKLEAEVELRVDQRNALQQEIYCLKEELNDFNKRHKDMTGQLESVGLNPETFASTVKELQDENTKLKYACERDRDEKLAFLEKLKIMEKLIEKNALLENSLSDLNVELESVQGRVKTLEESCHSLLTAKSALAAEKEALISQLQIATENLEKLSEKNNILENSLFGANAELGGLRVKIKSLENSCLLLGDEKSGLITQREGLLSELDVNQKRLEDLAKRYQGLEEKYASLEEERESTLREIEELQKSLAAEKQEHASLVRLHETQVTAMESQIHSLQGESFCRKKEYEEELDNAMNAQVEIFILQKCAQDLEENNLSLLLECRKLLAASELSEKLISELELGNSKKQMEINSLFDQITLLRMGLYQMLRTLEIDAIRGHHDKIKQDQSVLDCIFGRLQKTQNSLLKSLDENQQFIIENSVLIELLRQLKLEAENLAAEKNSLHQELKVQSVQLSELENALFDANTELEGLREKVKSLENSCLLLGDEKSGLITQREVLISETDVSRKRLADLEKRYQGLEEKYVGLEMERESTLREVEELQKSLDAEKQEHASFTQLHESQVTAMESQIHFLQGESLCIKKEYEEELDKAMNAQVEIFILQKCAQDLEQNNICLLLEYRKLLEAFELSAKLISKLELGNSKKQMEIKSLFDQINRLRMGLDQMLRTLEIDAIHGYDDKIKQDQSVLHCIFGRLQRMQNSLLKSLDENQQFIIENSVLIGLLGQLKLEAENLATENNSLHQELKVQSERFSELENSLFDANAKLEGLEAKLNSLEKSCLLLGHEKSGLLKQREGLISELNFSQKRLEDLEKRYQELEEKYVGLEKERDSTLCEAEELRKSLDAEKQEHATFVKLNETRVTSMESKIHFLQGESLCRKEEYEEQLDKAMNAQVQIFILQKCAQDLEENNLSLSLECRKLLEASKLSKRLISELELGSSKKQMEIKSLFDQITVLRMGLYQMSRTLEIDAVHGYDDMIKQDQSILDCIYGRLQKMQNSLLMSLDKNQQFIIEKSVLIELLWQLKLEAENLATENNSLHQELNIQSEQFSELQNRAKKLAHTNEELRSKVMEGVEREEVLRTEIGSVCVQLLDLQRSYQSSLEENCKLLDEKRTLMKEVLDLGKEKHNLEEENFTIFAEAISQSNISLIFKDIIADSIVEIKHLSENLDKLKCFNNDLEGKVRTMEIKFEDMLMENSHLKDSVQNLENELVSVRSVGDQLKDEVVNGRDLLCQKENELLQSEQLLSISQEERAQLHKVVENLKTKYEEIKLIGEDQKTQIVKLSGDYDHQSKETESLRQANQKFEAEILKLHEELQESKHREESLSVELRKGRNEVEIWETQATALFGELQNSAIREALLEEKAHELSMETESIRQANQKFEAELLKLHEEIQERKHREENLSVELQKGRNEVELWETQAAALFGELQSSAVREALLEEKAHELSMETESIRQANQKFEAVLLKLREDIQERKHREESLSVELQKGRNEVELWETQAAALFGELQSSAFREALLEDKAHELSLETENIRRANQKFEAELSKLHKELKERKHREESLSVELQKGRNEVELWETQAAAFFGELQSSSVREALLEEKAHELGAECEVLESRGKSKAMEVEELERSVRILECQNEGLKAQLAAYVPAVRSLIDSVRSLESQTLLNPKHPKDYEEVKDANPGTELHAENCQQTIEDQIASTPDGFSDLQGIHMRIIAIEKAVLEMEKLSKTENLNLNSKLETAMRQIEELRYGSSSRQESITAARHVKAKQEEAELGQGLGNNVKMQRPTPEISEEDNETMAKDIALDQISDCSSHGLSRRETAEVDDKMLELWETADCDGTIDLNDGKFQKMVTAPTDYQQISTVKAHKGNHSSRESLVKELGVDKERSKRFTEPDQEGSKRKILERLDSDAQKLANLQITVEDLKRKVETTEKSRKGKGIEYGTVKEQLGEAEEAIMKLFDVNRKLITQAEDNSWSLLDKKSMVESDESGSVRKRSVSEQARKGSEKIGRLQVEVQKIQFLLLKLDDEKESRGRTRITERKTSVLLRDFIYGGIRTSQKRKKALFCACVQPPTKGD